MTLKEKFQNWLDRIYYSWYACRRGRHYMKFSGCVYCGSTEYRAINYR